MLSDGKATLVRITADNYPRFKVLSNWRRTGTRQEELPLPTEQELAFADRDGYWVWAAEIEGQFAG